MICESSVATYQMTNGRVPDCGTLPCFTINTRYAKIVMLS